MRTFASAHNSVVYRAVVTRKWTDSNSGIAHSLTECVGPYTRAGDAQRSATRITRWWDYRRDMEVTVDIQRSALNWESMFTQPTLP